VIALLAALLLAVGGAALIPTARAAAPDCAPPATPADALQVGLRAHGHEVGGLGIASFEAAAWSLTLLAPAGFELFTVSGPPATVATGLEQWRPWLTRLPVERDLRLAFTPVTPGACRSGGGHLRTRVTATGWERRWCGPGGHATATRAGDTIHLVDRPRGYDLTLVVAHAPG
jgi:hypothetical protein